MAKVWLTNEGYHDYSKAKRFGDVHTLTRSRVNVFQVDNLRHHIISQLDQGKASPNDFVLISGYAIVNSIVIHYFLKKFGKVYILQWEANRDDYTTLTLQDFEVNAANRSVDHEHPRTTKKISRRKNGNTKEEEPAIQKDGNRKEA